MEVVLVKPLEVITRKTRKSLRNIGFSAAEIRIRESGQQLLISSSEVMKLNLKSLRSDLQIITKPPVDTIEHKVMFCHLSFDVLGERGWWVILPLLSIQNVCDV